MATRAAYDAVSGNVANAADVDKWAKGWLCIEESTTPATTTATTELTIFTQSVGVLANRKLKLTFHVQKVGTTVNADEFVVRIYYDGTAINRTLINRPDQTADDGISVHATVSTTTAGNKTIAVTAQRTAGTGTVTLAPVAGAPMFLLVEDIGSSS